MPGRKELRVTALCAHTDKSASDLALGQRAHRFVSCITANPAVTAPCLPRGASSTCLLSWPFMDVVTICPRWSHPPALLPESDGLGDGPGGLQVQQPPGQWDNQLCGDRTGQHRRIKPRKQ